MKTATLRRIYLREAVVTLLMAKLAVRLFSSQRVSAFADRPPRRINRFPDNEIGWVTWSVETIGSKPWMNALDLPRALAAQHMLRRRGIASRLCLGLARDGGALVWVEIGQQINVGGTADAGFICAAPSGGERT